MPMPLMGKKPPTPQELYKARKQREEEERNVLLPPGLINHGNTCFMNSVLQGLFATPILYDLVRFSLPDGYLPIASQRSPQLTNGHGNGGQYEREWEEGMPLGDIFVMLMNKAWKTQEDRQRTSLSPKEILTRLGKKYDQYLDFRQQDAHELLRHLLDATRMEEFDIIKQRQPRPPKAKRRKMDPSAAALLEQQSTVHEQKEIPEDQRLTSFVDMAFGGQLASVLVCDKCKKVSMTFEDFDDLSLPIKAEDYERVRRRDRIKSFAKKLRFGGLDTSTDQPRSSSTPASPTRKSIDPEKIFERSSISDDRRRSLDEESVVSALEGKSVAGAAELPSLSSSTIELDAQRSNTTSNSDRELLNAKHASKRSNRDDAEGWKLSRHISLRLGRKGRGKESRKGKDKDSSRVSSVNSSSAMDPRSKSRVNSSEAIPTLNDTDSTSGSSSALPAPSVPSVVFPRPPISRAHSASPTISALDTPILTSTPVLASSPKGQSGRESASPASRPRSPQPTSLSRQETEYLRRLLTDVPSTSALPFSNLFRPTVAPSLEPNGGFNSAWTKIGGVQSVEDCLRMFTGVEILDGENRYGCRRCWKMTNGTYVERGRALSKRFAGDCDSSSEEEEGEKPSDGSADDACTPTTQKITAVSPMPTEGALGTSSGSSADPNAIILVAPVAVALHGGPSDQETKLTTNEISVIPPNGEPDVSTNVMCSAFSVPVISMTEAGPETTIGQETPSQVVNHQDVRSLPRPLMSSSSRDSLKLPESHQHCRHPASLAVNRSFSTDSSTVSSEDSDLDIESDVDLSASVLSETSSMASQEKAPRDNKAKEGETLPTVTIEPPDSNEMRKSKSNRDQRAKQVIPQRAFKRYLIAKPPPVLVIHLKRFQQVGKPSMHATYFSNLKKLDDNVAFPEYLDLSPFLLPKKEEYGLGSKIAGEHELKPPFKVDKCLYRLYAVVVHIGNMLGGHYIAYTALPDSSLAPNGSRASSSSGENSTAADEPGVRSRPSNSRANSFQSSSDPKQKSTPVSSRKWCYISDTIVKLTTLEEVLKSKAYICMYERI